MSNVEEIFKVNQRLDVMLATNLQEKYPSRIEEYTPQHMIIAMPMSKGYPIFLAVGSRFYGKIITNGLVYQFTSTFLDKRMSPLPVWIVSHPENVKKIQQRSFVRIDAMLDVEMKIISESVESEQAAVAVLTKDVSGGGVRLVCKQPLDAHTKLHLKIDIPEAGVIEAMSEVIRVEKPTSEFPVFWVSTKFIDIQENSRSKLIKFIFKKQLEQRQKGV